MIRLYLDEDSSRRSLVAALRASQVDALTAIDAGMAGCDDPEQLAYATAQGRVLLTCNVGDYARLHAQGVPHAGIIVVPQQRLAVGEQLRAIVRLVATISAAEMVNHLEYLTNWHRQT